MRKIKKFKFASQKGSAPRGGAFGGNRGGVIKRRPYCEVHQFTPMQLRTNSETGKKFWGCAKFPSCALTREVVA